MNAGILFDYNGVIVTDEHVQQKAMGAVLARYSLSLSNEEYNKFCYARTDRAAFENLQNKFPELQNQPVEELVAEKIAEYMKLTAHELFITPGVQEKLHELHEHFKIGMVTGSAHAELDRVLKQGNLAQYFDVIISADDISRSKPDPEGYLKGIAALGLPKEKVVAIEDTHTGLTAAKAAGLKCIVLQHGPIEEFAAADKVIAKVTDLTPDIIQELIVG